ncbi:MAG: cytochrome C oxidase subunit IV family protein [Sulfurimonas sp.]|nr:cytochrome C oxidase subunit IV family protein [Sulfurimonas sp.]
MDIITKIWVVLLGFTLFAFLLGWLKLVSLIGVAILLLTTFIKGQLVIDYFMGLNEVELKYRVIPTIWLGVVILLIAVAYYLPV